MQYVMPPHELIGALFSFDERLFKQLFLGIPGDLEAYWLANGRHCEDLSGFDDFRRVVPLRVYGDGADVSRSQHFELISLLPVLTSASTTLDTRMAVSIRSTTVTEKSAVDAICSVIAWSFAALRSSVESFSGFN